MFRIMRLRLLAPVAFVAVAIVAACQSNPATEMVRNAKAAVRPLCPLGGCDPPDLPIWFDSAYGDSVHHTGDSVLATDFLIDTITGHNDRRVADTVWVVWHVGPNPDDTTVTVSTEAVANCTNPSDCHLRGFYEAPNPITLDPDESTQVTGWYVTDDTTWTGTGVLIMNAGAGQGTYPFRIYTHPH